VPRLLLSADPSFLSSSSASVALPQHRPGACVGGFNADYCLVHVKAVGFLPLLVLLGFHAIGLVEIPCRLSGSPP